MGSSLREVLPLVEEKLGAKGGERFGFLKLLHSLEAGAAGAGERDGEVDSVKEKNDVNGAKGMAENVEKELPGDNEGRTLAVLGKAIRIGYDLEPIRLPSAREELEEVKERKRARLWKLALETRDYPIHPRMGTDL